MNSGKEYDIGQLEQNYESFATYNSQFKMLMNAHYPSVGMICAVSPLLLLEVVFQTFFLKHLKFCEGVSDYKWSVRSIVVSQIITIVLGTLVISFRWFSMASHLDPFKPKDVQSIEWNCSEFQVFEVFARLRLNWKMYSDIASVLEDIVIFGLFAIEVTLTWMGKVVIFLTWMMRKPVSLIKGNTVGYFGMNATEDLINWRNERQKEEPHHLVHLLSRTQPSQDFRSVEGINDCLLLVILVRLAPILLPPHLSKPLINALDEAFSVIYFVDKRMDSMGFQNMYKRRLAKDLWMTRDMSNHWFQKKVIKPLQMSYPQDVLTCANADSHSEYVPTHPLEVIKELGQLLNCPLFFNSDERLIIKSFIEDGRYGTFIELYERMEQLFVDKVSLFLTELPNVALGSVLQSSTRELEKKMRVALKLMYKLEQVHSQVQWLSVNVTNKESIAPLVGNNLSVVGPVDTVLVSTHVTNGDEIIQVDE